MRKNIEKNFVMVLSRFNLADSACIVARVVMYDPCATQSGPADKPKLKYRSPILREYAFTDVTLKLDGFTGKLDAFRKFDISSIYI